jgi:phosphate/sulfate permease
MYKMVGLWFILVVCVLVVGYGAYLAVANGPRETGLMLYPWQEGNVLGIWVLAVVLGMGIALVPLVRLLVRTIRGLRAAREERTEAKAKRDQVPARRDGAGRV